MNQRSRQAVAECESVIEVITRLKVALPELERRNRFGVSGDGYSSSSFRTSGQKGAVSTPTENAALSRPERDPVRVWTRDILRSLEKGSRVASDINSLLTMVLGERSCEECGRSDAPRLVAGLCDTCRMRKRRAAVM